VTINNKGDGYTVAYWNENNSNPLSITNWRASLVPAAAVIPAPVAYTNVAAVKKLVVGFLFDNVGPVGFPTEYQFLSNILPSGFPEGSFTLKKLECLKQAYAMNTLAWNNKGLRVLFCWFLDLK
jgi:hypothetical protein